MLHEMSCFVVSALFLALASSSPLPPSSAPLGTCPPHSLRASLGLPPPPGRGKGGQTPASAPHVISERVEHEYIVRFHVFRPLADIRGAMSDALGPEGEGTWAWVERPAAAHAFPSDFAVLRVSHPEWDSEASLAHRIRSQASQGGSSEAAAQLRGVHAQRRLSRSLLFYRPHDNPDGTVNRGGEGRWQTRPTIGLGLGARLGFPDDPLDPSLGAALSDTPPHPPSPNSTSRGGRGGGMRRLLAAAGRVPRGVVGMLGAHHLWARGVRGKGIRVGIFDTGFSASHPHFHKAIRERTNWTHEPTLDDRLGHGTFVAGVVAGEDSECPGFAPEVELYEFRVFTNDQVSFTSWFMDAFNYAIQTKMDIVNLSIGGPDYLDEPFVDKVHEVTASGIAMISAIGNDGPLYGTLNNPGDMLDVLGVGGVDNFGSMATFSSRGATLWEMPEGQGRIKPDVVAYGVGVSGSNIGGGCRALSGTSVAAPVVAGAAALVASVLPAERRHVLNPASIKQVMIEGADRLPTPNIHEQGVGRINPVRSAEILEKYEPRASLVPDKLDLTQCRYMWPYCLQPLYAGKAPLIINATILNGMGVLGHIVSGPFWEPSDSLHSISLDVRFEHSAAIHPWAGYLAVYMRVRDSAPLTEPGLAEGHVSFAVRSPPPRGEAAPRLSLVRVPLKVKIIPPPSRYRRLLFDLYHSAKYPASGFVPKDGWEPKSDSLDWHGDHPHTNYHDLLDQMVTKKGLYLDLLHGPFTCFDAARYGGLILADPEEEFHLEEINKLEADVRDVGLGLLVTGDWHNLDHAQALTFYDDNTRGWWKALTGGCNVPALNELIGRFGLELSEYVVRGAVAAGSGLLGKVQLSAASTIRSAPAGSFLLKADLDVKRVPPGMNKERPTSMNMPFAAYLPLSPNVTGPGRGYGRIVVLSDSECIDSDSQLDKCWGYFFNMMAAVLPEPGVGGDPAAPGASPASLRGGGPYGGLSVLEVTDSWLRRAAGGMPIATPYADGSPKPERFPGRPFDAVSRTLRDRRLYGGPRCPLSTPLAPEWRRPGPLREPGDPLTLDEVREAMRRKKEAVASAPVPVAGAAAGVAEVPTAIGATGAPVVGTTGGVGGGKGTGAGGGSPGAVGASGVPSAAGGAAGGQGGPPLDESARGIAGMALFVLLASGVLLWALWRGGFSGMGMAFRGRLLSALGFGPSVKDKVVPEGYGGEEGTGGSGDEGSAAAGGQARRGVRLVPAARGRGEKSKGGKY